MSTYPTTPHHGKVGHEYGRTYTAAEGLVKELQGRVNGGMGLQEAEAKILEMVNWIGDEMVQEVVAGLAEPTTANQITVDDEVAVFERVRNLRFINRFGEVVVPPAALFPDGGRGRRDDEPADHGAGRGYRCCRSPGADQLQGVQPDSYRQVL